MTVWGAILLGLVQGLTEFFPVSSSAHLSILQNFLRIGTQDDLFFDVLLHLGTLAAVILAFWPDCKTLFSEALEMVHIVKAPRGKRPNALLRRMISFLIIGTLPLLLVIFFKDAAESLYENTFFVGFALLVTGGLLYYAERYSHGNKDVKNATVRDVLLVGLAQALAVLPGLSRSGSTISTGLLCGFERSFAVRYSFLLSIPAVLGANLLTFVSAVQNGIEWQYVPMYLLGVLTAFLSGFAAIYFLRRIVQRGKFSGFCFYCWGAGLVTLILSLVA